MSNAIGNRYLQGTPTLSYPQFKAYSGADIFLDVAFVDHTNTPVTPTTLIYQVDDITNSVNMIASAPVTVGLAPTMTLQLPGGSMQMTYQYLGSQLCQLAGYFQAIDSVTGTQFTGPFIYIIELCAIASPVGISFP